MSFTTGTVLTLGNSFTTGTVLNLDSTAQGVVSGKLRFVGSLLHTNAVGSNESNIVAGDLKFHGSVLATIAASGILVVEVFKFPTIQATDGQEVDPITKEMEEFAIDYFPFHTSDLQEKTIVDIAIVNNLPVDTVTYSILTGDIAHTYLYDYYFRVHLSTNSLDLGTVFSDQQYVLTIWNAWFIDNTLTSTSGSTVTGVSTVASVTLPYTFKPLEMQTITISAATTGSAVITGGLNLNFTTELAITLIAGLRVIMWPFLAVSEFTESKEWLTDIIYNRRTERRYNLRDKPRQTIKYNHIFKNNVEFNMARTICRNSINNPMGFPLWSDTARLPKLVAGATRLTFDTTNLEFGEGSVIVVWENYRTYEICEVAVKTSTYIDITKPLQYKHDKSWFAPVVTGYAQISLSENENHKRTASASVLATDPFVERIVPDTNTVQDPYDLMWFEGYIGLERWFGVPILIDNPVTTSGLSIEYDRKQEVLDSMVGSLEMVDVESFTREKNTISFMAKSRTAVYRLRRWFDIWQGKYRFFILPSFKADIIPAADYIGGSSIVTVVDAQWAKYPIKYIRARVFNTNWFYIEVDSVTSNGDGTENLHIIGSYPTNIPLNQINRMELLTLVRLDTDTVEFVHKSHILTTVKANVIEVPIG